MAETTITYLQQLHPGQLRPSSAVLPAGARIERVEHPTAEFSRFLYQSVGSGLHWADRLVLTRSQWQQQLQRPGSETWVLYHQGAPQGYAELAAAAGPQGTEAEIFYFGLFPQAIGQGLGGVLLTETVRQAWSLHERHALPAVQRVWLHTCSLDGPGALPNYLARGFEIYATEVEAGEPKDAAAGLWPH